MSDIVFKDCEYRYVEEDGTLCCKNKQGIETDLSCENEQLKKEIKKLKTSKPVEKCKEAKNMECINCLYIYKCDYFKNRVEK